MKYLILTAIFSTLVISPDFKTEQKQYSRVKSAYSDKYEGIKSTLDNKSVSIDKMRIYLRAFKKEKELQLWAKNSADATYQLIETYDFCSSSGTLGPKRKQGDMQIPEGYYHIDRFNPWSNFHLSLGVNYPNKSDRVLSDKESPGGDIFIHGNCVTIGCIPITDDKIKELYIYAVEARNNGQTTIPVTFFPAKLTRQFIDSRNDQYDDAVINLWEDLLKGYNYFNQHKKLPSITFKADGRHEVK